MRQSRWAVRLLRVSDSPIRAALRAFDALDLDAAVSMFAPGATLMTAFGEEVVGGDAVREQLRTFLGELRSTRHEVTSEWNPEPEVWVAEVAATYELTDFSRRGPYRRAVVLRQGDHGIEQLRIYGAHELPLPQTGLHYDEVRGPHGWLPTL